MNERIIVGNFKMNLDVAEIAKYLKIANENISSNQVIICPTSIYIPYFLKNKYQVGLQDVFYKEKGSYTGEISPMQAKKMGINYVILGHSERRIHLDEKDEIINKKVKEALKHNLKVILCIGETNEERSLLKTDKVLRRQLKDDLKGIDDLDNLYIAYEPVWAIGSNQTPTNLEIDRSTDYIKAIAKSINPNYKPKVLYGGSVNAKNIKQLIEIDGLSGFLVGGSSLKIEEFLQMIEVVIK